MKAIKTLIPPLLIGSIFYVYVLAIQTIKSVTEFTECSKSLTAKDKTITKLETKIELLEFIEVEGNNK